MTGYEQFLTVTLATFLGVFLILSIVLLVVCIKIALTIKRISTKAEHLADKAEAVSDFFRQAAEPMALGRAIATVTETFFSRKKHKSKGKD